MALHSIGIRLNTNGTTGSHGSTLLTISSATKRVRLLELHFIVTSAVFNVIGLTRPIKNGYIPLISNTFLPENPSDSTITDVIAVTRWQVPPRVNYHYLLSCAATMNNGGASYLFNSSNGIIIDPNNQLCLFSLNGQGNASNEVGIIIDA